MGIFERFLTAWVLLAIALGVLLGNWLPGLFSFVVDLEVKHVNLVVALLIWVMIYPMMVQVNFTSIKAIADHPRGLALTLVTNWMIKPLSTALLGWIFLTVVFAGWIEPVQQKEYLAGMILLGAAPCTAMVFIWSQLTEGDPNYTLVQVAVNDTIMVFAFAPIAGFLLGVSDIEVPWETLVLSVVLYVIIPLLAGVATRYQINRKASDIQLQRFLHRAKPWSVAGLLATVVLLFGFQARFIIQEPQMILFVAIPLVLQTCGIFALAYTVAMRIRLPHKVAAPACLIGASNFFELAVAVAISLFGLNSGAALATVVGVLVEVPVMLSLVYVANKTKHKFT
ncbi:MAG: arsenical-resistance protein [Dehalococcoidia bacterium]|nr:arsenical-resistance protein [Dehalococcoidia bacterium]|tara:strand:+ start:3119 stop:4135 length:1017 start_codon:yes stop_codon:yes gene_type:complete